MLRHSVVYYAGHSAVSCYHDSEPVPQRISEAATGIYMDPDKFQKKDRMAMSGDTDGDSICQDRLLGPLQCSVTSHKSV